MQFQLGILATLVRDRGDRPPGKTPFVTTVLFCNDFFQSLQGKGIAQPDTVKDKYCCCSTHKVNETGIGEDSRACDRVCRMPSYSFPQNPFGECHRRKPRVLVGILTHPRCKQDDDDTTLPMSLRTAVLYETCTLAKHLDIVNNGLQSPGGRYG